MLPRMVGVFNVYSLEGSVKIVKNGSTRNTVIISEIEDININMRLNNIDPFFNLKIYDESKYKFLMVLRLLIIYFNFMISFYFMLKIKYRISLLIYL